MLRRRSAVPFRSTAATGTAAIQLTSGQRIDFGSGTRDYMYGTAGQDIINVAQSLKIAADIGAGQLYIGTGATINLEGTAYITGDNADGGTAVSIRLDTPVAYTVSGSKITSFRNNTVEKANVDKDGCVLANNFGYVSGGGATGATQGMGFSGSTTQFRVATTADKFDFSAADGTTYATIRTGLAGTAGSGTGITANNTAELRTFVNKITVTEAALTAAAASQDITLWTVAAQTKITRVIAQSTAGFTGGSVSNMTITVGKAAGTAEYLASGSIFGAAVLGDVVAEMGAGLKSATLDDFPNFAGAGTISCRFTATGDNVVNCTAGSVTFWIEGTVYP